VGAGPDRDVLREAVLGAVAGVQRPDVTTRRVREGGRHRVAVDVDVHGDRVRDVGIDRPAVDTDQAGAADRVVDAADRVPARDRRRSTVHEDFGDPHLSAAVGHTDADPLEAAVDHVGVVLRRRDERVLQRRDARATPDVLAELAPTDGDTVGQVRVAEAARGRHVRGPGLGLRSEHGVGLQRADTGAGAQGVDTPGEVGFGGGVRSGRGALGRGHDERHGGGDHDCGDQTSHGGCILWVADWRVCWRPCRAFGLPCRAQRR
jgi:hypothetical protein